MSLDELLRVKRQEILQLAAKHGADHIRVFGSVARGEAKPDSDIDLLVNLAPGRSLMDHAALILDLQRLLGCRVDVVTERGLRERVRQRVLAEAVPL
jgi:predicted nucleotidyltransferase